MLVSGSVGSTIFSLNSVKTNLSMRLSSHGLNNIMEKLEIGLLGEVTKKPNSRFLSRISMTQIIMEGSSKDS